MKKFLSIDMDFWNNNIESAAKELFEILNNVKFRNRAKIHAFMNHQQILPYVNSSKARYLINFDTHSDLAGMDYPILECGTWVSFVDWRRKGSYFWLHRSNCTEGDCNGSPPIFYDTIQKGDHSLTDWKSVKHSVTEKITTRLFNNVVDCGICLSPSYIANDRLEDIFRYMVDLFRIPYTKGRRSENQQRKMLAPMDMR